MTACRFSGDSLTPLFAARVLEAYGSAAVGAAVLPAHALPASASNAAATALGFAPSGGSSLSCRILPSALSPALRMDLVAFLDFLLAWEHRGTSPALRYFWPVLDLRHRGHVDRVCSSTAVYIVTGCI